MANGEWLVLNKDWSQIKLLDATASAADDGVWIDCQRYASGLVDVDLSSTGTTELRGSLAATKPANNTHGYLVTTAFTADGQYAIVTTPRFLKARTTANAGTISVTVLLRTNGG